MKYIYYFSLSMLLMASTQSAFAMKEATKSARFEGIKNGFYAGLFSGLGWGSWAMPNNELKGMCIACLPIAGCGVWSAGKNGFYAKTEKNNLQKADKKAVKKTYHTYEFATNVLTTTALAAAAYGVSSGRNPFSDSFSESGVKFLGIAAGITALKWMTYDVSRSNELANRAAKKKAALEAI